MFSSYAITFIKQSRISGTFAIGMWALLKFPAGYTLVYYLDFEIYGSLLIQFQVYTRRCLVSVISSSEVTLISDTSQTIVIIYSLDLNFSIFGIIYAYFCLYY